jgi:hypothetical protein
VFLSQLKCFSPDSKHVKDKTHPRIQSLSQHRCPQGCQKCIFFSAPTQIMVPWYTVDPPINGLCPKQCSCAEKIVDEYVSETLECYYSNYVCDITEQFVARELPTKESILKSAADTYWHNKADMLCIRPDLLDLSAPLPPCVANLVESNVDHMLDDLKDIEEWYYAFEKAPTFEKNDIIDGYQDGSYRDILKKRRSDRALDLVRLESVSPIVEEPPLFGPPTKKLKQTTLTQVFPDFPEKETVEDPHQPKAVVDFSAKLTSSNTPPHHSVVIDLTSQCASVAVLLTPIAAKQPEIGPPSEVTTHAAFPSDLKSRFTTPPPRPKHLRF